MWLVIQKLLSLIIRVYPESTANIFENTCKSSSDLQNMTWIHRKLCHTSMQTLIRSLLIIKWYIIFYIWFTYSSELHCLVLWLYLQGMINVNYIDPGIYKDNMLFKLCRAYNEYCAVKKMCLCIAYLIYLRTNRFHNIPKMFSKVKNAHQIVFVVVPQLHYTYTQENKMWVIICKKIKLWIFI